ncbi:hypothetical protein CYY_001414 [Polysphondylium violaceum]|uniref:DUF1279 domain-containing protein n=1 Tax=Polysphondylium violaceum TaxID=133409 RepID=A0A8J4Q3B4_9MYCE|nr:hypothetical protein CYY_001414 [Polysphondylium violaceum]
MQFYRTFGKTSQYMTRFAVLSPTSAAIYKQSFTSKSMVVSQPKQQRIAFTPISNTTTIKNITSQFNKNINTYALSSSPYIFSSALLGNACAVRRYSTEVNKDNKDKKEQDDKEIKENKEKDDDDDDSKTSLKGLSIKEKVKYIIKKYGVLGVVVYFSIYGATLGGFYYLLSMGVDANTILETLHLPQTQLGEKAGIFGAAFVLTKLTSLIRIPLTLAILPPLSRYLRRRK